MTKTEQLKEMEQFSVTAVVTAFPDDIDNKLMYQINRVMQHGAHMLGVMSPESYADHCTRARLAKLEIRDKMDYYREGESLPYTLFEYLVAMVKMPETNRVLDPFPEHTGGAVKRACEKLNIECVELT